MQYITVREAAQRWGISQRLVQKYCAQERIQGAVKEGSAWRIPADASKPQDPRRADTHSKANRRHTKAGSGSGLMPLMNSAFKPGECLRYIAKMPDGARKSIAMAEYYYFSGNPEKAVEEAELFLTSEDLECKLSACLLCAYANLSMGQIHRARYALAQVKKILADDLMGTSAQLRAAKAFIACAASVLLHLPLPQGLPPVQEFMPLLPPGLRMFALYVQAHHTYLQQDYSRSLGIVETAFVMQTEIFPIPAIYLHLVAVMDYMSLKQPQQAQAHLLAAWNLARPDDLIEGFGEHHGLLGGMLEAVIKRDWPEDFKRIIAITYRFSSGWRRIHNPVTGDDVADNLTTTEFATAMLAARGWTNQEIAKHLGISTNTVKQYISNALQKLGIKQRKDLKRFMLR